MHNAGIFDATILDHGFIHKQSMKAPQFWAKFKTDEGHITGFFSLTHKSAQYTIQKIRAMGFQGDDLMSLNDGNELAGNRVTITVDHEVYQDKKRAKVGWVNALGDTGLDLEHDEKAARNARHFNALLSKENTKPINKDPDFNRSGGEYHDDAGCDDEAYPWEDQF